jgi:stage II sporulation protein D
VDRAPPSVPHKKFLNLPMLRLLFILAFFFACIPLNGKDIKVRLYSDQTVKRLMLTPDSADFVLLALNNKGEVFDTILDIYSENPNRNFVISQEGTKLKLKVGDELIGLFEGLFFSGLDTLHQFRVLANHKERAYFGGLHVQVQSAQIYLINEVNLEHYVAGVVESEAGHVSESEFYKAQAVLARTFALRNWKKHLSAGYNLKDDVSSQVYFSKAHFRNRALILDAVTKTRDTVLVNLDCQPILSVFHANSGGFTVNSENVWLKPVPELKSVIDSFSIGVGSYSWEKRIPADQFYNYFSRMFGVKNDAELQKALLNFDQNQRQSHFKYKGKTLKLTKVRHDFRLRSTFFEIALEGETIVLHGNGYGHGVGLSQDGAIEMSRQGYDYKSILQHYFNGVDLESLHRYDSNG